MFARVEGDLTSPYMLCNSQTVSASGVKTMYWLAGRLIGGCYIQVNMELRNLERLEVGWIRQVELLYR